MDSGTVMVLVLTLAAVVLLVLAERHCRRNEAKAESAVKSGADKPSSEAGRHGKKSDKSKEPSGWPGPRC